MSTLMSTNLSKNFASCIDCFSVDMVLFLSFYLFLSLSSQKRINNAMLNKTITGNHGSLLI